MQNIYFIRKTIKDINDDIISFTHENINFTDRTLATETARKIYEDLQMSGNLVMIEVFQENLAKPVADFEPSF